MFETWVNEAWVTPDYIFIFLCLIAYMPDSFGEFLHLSTGLQASHHLLLNISYTAIDILNPHPQLWALLPSSKAPSRSVWKRQCGSVHQIFPQIIRRVLTSSSTATVSWTNVTSAALVTLTTIMLVIIIFTSNQNCFLHERATFYKNVSEWQHSMIHTEWV